MSIVIAPSILSADFTRLGEQIRTAQAAGADWIHVDVMDGHFVPNITMGSVITRACRSVTELPLDVHLMIEQPERHIEEFVRAGASRLTVHVETCPHLYRTLQWIRELGCLPGVSLNPGTPASSLGSVLHLVDLVLVMTVSPGFGGQEYLHPVTAKIREIRHDLNRLTQQPGWKWTAELQQIRYQRHMKPALELSSLGLQYISTLRVSPQAFRRSGMQCSFKTKITACAAIFVVKTE